MASTVNEHLVYLQVRHAIHLLRYGNGVERDILKLLATVERDILERIAARIALIDERGFDLGPATTKRLEALLAEVRAVNEGVYQKAYTALTAELGAFAITEAAFQAKSLEAALPVNLKAKLPSPVLLRSIATQRPIEGLLLKTHFGSMSETRMRKIEAAIRSGMTQGRGVDAIVREIRGTKAQNYKDGVFEGSRRSARTIVRTSINHVANHAAQETWRSNENVIKGWQFVATLDSRTTVICGSLDGQSFKVGEGPIPPRHLACRSITVAVTKSFKEMGLDRKDYTPDQRASMDGQVVAPQTFDTWLSKQSSDRQIAVLGKTRAELWRSGKMNLRDFIRDNREVITLDELKKLYPAAFS